VKTFDSCKCFESHPPSLEVFGVSIELREQEAVVGVTVDPGLGIDGDI
jgi:hypothetical protein